MDIKRQADRLGDFVRDARNAHGLSLTDVQRASHNTITAAYVSLIENGRVENPGVGKLRALARGLGLTEEELFAVARGGKLSEPDAQAKQLLTFYQQLPSERQTDLLRIARALHAAHGVRPADELKTIKQPRRKAA